MFIRRLYYNLETGEIILSYYQTGSIVILDKEDELRIFPELQGYSIDELGVFEWLEPDEEVEAKMRGRYRVSVDISKTPHEVVFTELPEPEPTPEGDVATVEDYERALQELGV